MSAIEDLLLHASAPAPSTTEMPPDGTPTVIHGRYHTLHPETGRKVTFQRASNFAKVLSDDFGLQQWMMRMVLLGAAMRPDLTAQAIAVGASATKRLNELAEAAKEAAGGSKGANLGTAMHSLIERLEEGDTIDDLPAEMQRDLDAYREALVVNGVRTRPELLERIVCHPELGVTGRLDGIAHIDAWDVDVVTDNKTGKHMKWLEWSIQLAVYARAPFMWQPGAGWIEKPVVDLDRALVIHLPIGQGICGLHVLDIAAGWEACQQATVVKRWRNRKDLARPLQAVTGDVDLEALLAASIEPETTPAPVDPAFNNPKFIAERVAYEKDRLAKVLELLDGRPLPIARPEALPAPGAAYETWEPVQVLADWITALERELRAPFPPEPPDPFAGFDNDTVSGDVLAIVCGGPGGCQTITVPAAASDDARARIKAAFEQLPEDLQLVGTAEARARGVADVTRLSDSELVVLDDIVTAATVTWQARIDDAADLLAGWKDDERHLLVTAAGGGRPVERFSDDDIERLEALLAALGAGTLALAYEPDAAFAGTGDTAAAVVARFHGSKSTALVAAKGLADRHGRPRPKSTADVLADPVLTALVAHPRAAAGAETSATSNQQGAPRT